MSDVIGLIEVNLVVENFDEKFDADWGLLRAKVESIGRTEEDMEKDDYGRYITATAKVHLFVKDEVVIGEEAFGGCMNLWKVTATRASEVGDSAFLYCENLNEAILPSANSVRNYSFHGCPRLTNVRLLNATSIGKDAFYCCCALRHITLHPNINIDRCAFAFCLSLEALATCAGFELDTGDTYNGDLDPTVAITHYLTSQCELDTQRHDVFLTYNFMLKLCNHHIYKKTGVVRATPHDRLAHFLLDNEDLASHILSFFGMKWGDTDLRNASKERLLELGLQKKVLREENHWVNVLYWGVKVDKQGLVVSRRGDADWDENSANT